MKTGRVVEYGGLLIPWALRPLEKVVQTNCIRLLSLAGFEKPSSTSQYRASHIEPGIPDLVLFHLVLRRNGYWETKRPGETPTPKQVTWRDHCLATDTLHGWGTDEDLKGWLAELGLARFDGPVFGILRRSKWPDGLLDPGVVAVRSLNATRLHDPADFKRTVAR